MNIPNKLKRSFDNVLNKETDAAVKEELSYMSDYERNMFMEYLDYKLSTGNLQKFLNRLNNGNMRNLVKR